MIVSFFQSIRNAVRLSIKSRYAEIDGLRAVAVLLVVLAHAGLGNLIPGGSGVTIFFVLSGFVITNSVLREYAKTNSFNMKSFYLQRFLKIIPPIVVVIVLPSLFFLDSFKINPFHLLSQLLFFFNGIYMSGEAEVLPGSGVLWSLAIEEQFYLVFALLWLLALYTKRPVLYLGIGSVVAILAANASRFVLALVRGNEDRIYYGTDTRVDAIAVGVLLGILWVQKDAGLLSLSNRWGTLAAAISAVCFAASLIIRDPWFRDTLRFTIQAWSTAGFCLALLNPSKSPVLKTVGRLLRNRLMRFIGLSSYSIYLVHLIFFKATEELFSYFDFGLQVLLKLVLAVVLGGLAYVVVEVPFLIFRRRLKT